MYIFVCSLETHAGSAGVSTAAVCAEEHGVPASSTVNTDVFLFLFIIKCIKYHMRLLLVIIGENKLVFIMHGMKSPTLKI